MHKYKWLAANWREALEQRGKKFLTHHLGVKNSFKRGSKTKGRPKSGGEQKSEGGEPLRMVATGG